MTQAAVNIESTDTVAQREAPVIPVRNFGPWHIQGYEVREAIVRMPAGVIAQDLQDHPAIWRNVQSSVTALKRFDRVTCIAFDESWVVKDAMVIEADRTRVVLAIRPGDIIKIPGRVAEWEDDTVSIRWGGPGYGTYRKSDGVQVLPGFQQTVDAAKMEYFRSQPKAVGR